MTKRKYPSELNTRSIRVNIGDWQLLDTLSRQLDITVAKAFHQLITRQKMPEPISVTPRAQIPMAVDTAYALFPAPAHPSYRALPITAIATNGSKGAAFRIKLKGVRYA